MAMAAIDMALWDALSRCHATTLVRLLGGVERPIPAYGAVGYGLSATLTLKALAAAVVGGIGSLPGAFLGGLVIGVVEAGWSALFPIDDRDLAVYALLVLFIALRPSGLVGIRDTITHNLFPRRS